MREGLFGKSDKLACARLAPELVQLHVLSQDPAVSAEITEVANMWLAAPEDFKRSLVGGCARWGAVAEVVCVLDSFGPEEGGEVMREQHCVRGVDNCEICTFRIAVLRRGIGDG